MEKSLFNGEFVVGDDAIYTFAHYYRHPITRKRVVMVGMNHAGDADYFTRVKSILGKADYVIFEGWGARVKSTGEEHLPHFIERTNSEDLSVAFENGMKAFFTKAAIALRLQQEWTYFDHEQPNWLSGERVFYERLRNDESFRLLLEEKRKQCAPASAESMQHIVQYVRNALGAMDANAFTTRDLGNGFSFFWSNPELIRFAMGWLINTRDDLVLAEFDKLVAERNPDCIGIKFGAAHMINQRRLLEERGYKKSRGSVALRNIAF